MKKLLLIFFLTITTATAYGQKDWDSIIVIHPADTANLYKRVKHAFINMDFIVKDLESDTLTTYPREFETNSYVIGKAIIKGNSIILKGTWGTRKQDYFGSSTAIRNYQRVYYYKKSVEWQLLFLVAKAIGGEMKFEK